MTQLLLVRHAETALKGTFCGHTDPTLSAAGRAQLAALLERIGEAPVKLVVSSDLRRAQETAAPIADKFEVRHLLRPGLREVYFGDWEGMTWQEIEARDAQFAHRWHKEFPNLAIPGGEPLHDFEARIAAEVDYLRTLPAEGLTVVVTHGGVLRAMLKANGGDTQDQINYGEVIPYSL